MIIIFYILLTFLVSHTIIAAKPEQSIQIDVPEKIQTITVKKGETFTISLAANQSTGYTQVIKQIDPRFIKEINKEYKSRKTKRGLIGAWGNELFTLQAIKEGKTKIIVEYIRPWEKPVQPAGRSIFLITIE